jgi:uncharacterized membrane protein
MMNLETRTRSWVKSLIWRVIGVVLLGAIAYGVTGNWEQMTVITLIFHSLRIVLYYWHERIWDRIAWGRTLPLGDLRLKRPLAAGDRPALEDFLQQRGYL